MRLLLFLVAVVAAVVVAAELAAPNWVAAQAEAAIAAETEQRIAVDIDVSGPPLLIPVAINGTVDTWSMQLREVAGQDIPVDVVLDLDDVVLDRGRLARGDVVVRDVASATVLVRMDLSGSIPEALQPFADRLAEAGLPLLLEAVGGGRVQQGEGALVMGDVRLPIVEGSCTTESSGGVVTTRCRLSEIPAFVLNALQP